MTNPDNLTDMMPDPANMPQPVKPTPVPVPRRLREVLQKISDLGRDIDVDKELLASQRIQLAELDKRHMECAAKIRDLMDAIGSATEARGEWSVIAGAAIRAFGILDPPPLPPPTQVPEVTRVDPVELMSMIEPPPGDPVELMADPQSPGDPVEDALDDLFHAAGGKV